MYPRALTQSDVMRSCDVLVLVILLINLERSSGIGVESSFNQAERRLLSVEREYRWWRHIKDIPTILYLLTAAADRVGIVCIFDHT